MKNLLRIYLASVLMLATAFGQSTLTVNKSTGAITGPVSAATFMSANGIGDIDSDTIGEVAFLDLVDLGHLDFTPIDIATVLSGSTYTLVPGKHYGGPITGNKTFAFSRTMTTADAPTYWDGQITGTGTWTVPTLFREGASGSTQSVTVSSTGYFTASFSKDFSGNIRLKDTLPQLISNTDLDTTVITGMTEDTAPSGSNDYVMTYDDSATALKKVKINNLIQSDTVIWVALSDETTAITTGTAKVTCRAPYAFTVTNVRASLNTVSSSGTPTVDINEGGTTILSTKLTIDASELTSTTAATPAVISDSSIADDAEITFDIDTAGTGAKGLKVVVYGHR